MSLRLAYLTVVECLILSSPTYAIVLGQVDDFEDDTVMSWSGGSNPVNIASGGPSGGADNYLQISAVGGNLGARNDSQWLGDWLAAGVTRVEMDLRNGAGEELAVRIMVLGNSGEPYASTNAVAVPPDGAWHHAVFSVSMADMTNVGGGVLDINMTLADVSRVLIRHDSGAPDGPGSSSPVTGVLGIDNIRAAAEPPSPGDFDDDGDVDLDDHLHFTECMAGPGATPAPPAPATPQECLGAFDFDADTDVDLADAAEFCAVLAGS